MLHGFCVSRYFWDNQIPVLAAAGYFAVAPNQRGYAAGARPDPADFDNYRIDRLIGDALDIVDGAGHGERRFHLVGHDWGGSLVLDHRRSLARADRLAGHAVPPAPGIIRPRDEE